MRDLEEERTSREINDSLSLKRFLFTYKGEFFFILVEHMRAIGGEGSL